MKRNAIQETAPTVAASGLPGYESTAQFGVFAPAGTPAAIIQRLNQDIVKVINVPDVKKIFLTGGGEVGSGSPEEFAATIRSEMTRMGKVIRDAGIRIE